MSNSIIKTIFIQASCEQVWEYLVDKDKLGDWFHCAKETLTPGADYALLSTDRPSETLLGGTVLEYDPPNRLVYTFTHEWLKNVETLVTWELTSAFGGTRLHLTHSGFDTSHDPMGLSQDHDKGWDEHLAKLRTAPEA